MWTKGDFVESDFSVDESDTTLVSFPEGNLVEKVHGNQSIRYFCK
jgi:hypothetical protein